MGEWNEKPLGDLVELIIDHRGKTPRKMGGTDFTPTGVPVVSAIHIKGGRINWAERERYVPPWMFQKWMPVRLRRGDVLLTSEAPLGEVAQVPTDDDLVLSQRLFALRGHPERLDSSFLRYFFESAKGRQRLLARASGTTVVGIRQAELVKVSIPVPPMHVQRRIVRVLGAFDDLIETNRQLASKLEDHVSAVFKVFGFDAVPAGGKAVPLSSLVEINPRLPKPRGEAPYVDMAALPTDSSRIASVVRRPASGGARFQNGDTLLARLTPCLENGKAALVDVLDRDEIAVGSTEFVVLRDRAGVGSEWPYLLTRSDRFRDFAIQNMNGSSGRQRVSAEDIGRYPLPAPDQGRLERFKSTAAAAFAGIQDLNDEIGDLTRARDELLPLLMSGRVRVEDVEGDA